MLVGVLALQGCIDPHLEMLKQIGVDAARVRSIEELSRVDRLILPGGESSTMLKLLDNAGLFEPLREFGKTHPMWGICAGAILCARSVVHPEQRSLAVIDICAHRNFYGSQLDSFKSLLDVSVLTSSIQVDFIRAPKLEPLTDDVAVLASTTKDNPVLLQQGAVLVSAFHTELGTNPALHKYFVEMKAHE